jgi:hypothetical protein
MTGGASTHLTRSNYRGGPPLSRIGNRPVEEYQRTTWKAAAGKSAPSVDADPISSSDESDDDKSRQYASTSLVEPKRQRAGYGKASFVGQPGRYGHSTISRRAAESKDNAELLSSSESSLKSEPVSYRSPKRPLDAPETVQPEFKPEIDDFIASSQFKKRLKVRYGRKMTRNIHTNKVDDDDEEGSRSGTNTSNDPTFKVPSMEDQGTYTHMYHGEHYFEYMTNLVFFLFNSR